MDSILEKCAVFGVYGKGLDVAKLTYFGLYALQHRGQESSGISVADGKTIRTHKATGLVAQVYTEEGLESMRGYIAIGHNRYATSGGIFQQHTQPVTTPKNRLVLAHNGNLPQTKKLEAFLEAKKIKTEGMNDSELVHKAIEYYLLHGLSLKDGIKKAFPLLTGAFCLLLMTKDELVAIRDEYGIRPLSLGRLNGGYIISSETCAMDTVNATYIRDIAPGEMVVINSRGIKSFQLAKPKQKLDIFEFVYFSRPDSMLLGKRVYVVRENLGRELAKEFSKKADAVIPVPESAIPAAIGYSKQSGIPLELGLIKNRYIGRTFIMPDQKLRESGVRMKLNPIKEVISGKNLIVIDDSIVRGTTSKQLVAMLRRAGAKKVYVLSSCPPVKYPDFYGIATPKQKDLIAARMSVSKIQKFIGADGLYYLSYKGMIAATGLSERLFCTSCYTGIYPIDIGDRAKTIKKVQ